MSQRRPAESNLKDPSVPDLYLILYNCLQTVGWLAILFNTCLYLILYEGDWRSFPGVYEKTATSLNFFQSLAVVEVVHIMIGELYQLCLLGIYLSFLFIDILCFKCKNTRNIVQLTSAL